MGRVRSPRSFDDLIAAHRERLTAEKRVRNAEQLVKLVNALGMVFAFTPAEGIPIPACFDHLSTSDEMRKWSWMWGWKDELAAEKRIYYGPVLAKKPSFISMRLLPTLYATFGRAGEPDDHLEDVRSGRLSDIARRIIDHVAQRGESQSRRMRAELGITSKEGRGQYDRALDDAQRLMYVARVKAVGEGREEYNYTYDLFVRRYPEAVKAAERLSSSDARTAVLERCVGLAGAITERQISRVFGWPDDVVARTVEAVLKTRRVARRERGRDAILVLARYADAA